MEAATDEAATCEIARVETAISQIAGIENRVLEINILKTALLRNQSHKQPIGKVPSLNVGLNLLVYQLNSSAAPNSGVTWEHSRLRSRGSSR
jgi:hypothetical protein